MKLRNVAFIFALVLCAGPLSAQLSRWQTFSLSWYMRRARADMKIGSFRPAIESYQKALEIDPSNREALRNLGLAFEAQGLIDNAVATYDRYLALFPDDADIAFRQAEILSWSRYAYRRADALHYYDVAKKSGGDPLVDSRTAKILAPPRVDRIAELEASLARDPENGELMLALARAYESEGQYEKATGVYDRYLSRYPDDSKVAFHQAEILSWDRFSSRNADAMRYYRLGLENKSEPREQLAYARLLAADKETNPQAIPEYEKVLEKDPKNAEALRGLARAYAWNGDGDRAVYFAELARKADPSGPETKKIYEQTARGREPTLGGKIDFFTQHGGNFGLRGLSTSIDARADLNPFVTATGEIGQARYRRGSFHADDAFISAGIEARVRTAHRLHATFGHHSIGPESRSLAADVGYGFFAGDSVRKIGFKRELRADSLTALQGNSAGGTVFGAARSNSFYGELLAPAARARLWLRPYVGWVSARSVDSNKFWGADFRIDSPAFPFAYKAELSHYQEDQSGTGGYFSPKVFVNQTPLVVWRVTSKANHLLNFEAGPSLQYVRDAGLSGKFRLGAETNANYGYQFSRHFSARLALGFIRVADVYNRFSATASALYRF